MIQRRSPNPDDRLVLLTGPAYFIAALLVVAPLADFATAVWPWRWAAMDWRFASAGLLSGFLLTPLLGVLVAVGVAISRGHRRLLHVTGVVTTVAGVACLVLLAAFLLDAIQLGAGIPADQRRGFALAIVKAGLKFTLVGGAGMWLGVKAYAAGRPQPYAIPSDGIMVLRADRPISDSFGGHTRSEGGVTPVSRRVLRDG
ncbi:MAG: hypothetical protein ACT4R6_07260 [Gemmatimonadaceae bacterium]